MEALIIATVSAWAVSQRAWEREGGGEWRQRLVLSTLTTARQTARQAGRGGSQAATTHQLDATNWRPTVKHSSSVPTTQHSPLSLYPSPLSGYPPLPSVMTTCCSCGRAIKVIAKRFQFSSVRFAAFTFLPPYHFRPMSSCSTLSCYA